jgi:hypothetical protein
MSGTASGPALQERSPSRWQWKPIAVRFGLTALALVIWFWTADRAPEPLPSPASIRSKCPTHHQFRDHRSARSTSSRAMALWRVVAAIPSVDHCSWSATNHASVSRPASPARLYLALSRISFLACHIWRFQRLLFFRSYSNRCARCHRTHSCRPPLA